MMVAILIDNEHLGSVLDAVRGVQNATEGTAPMLGAVERDEQSRVVIYLETDGNLAGYQAPSPSRVTTMMFPASSRVKSSLASEVTRLVLDTAPSFDRAYLALVGDLLEPGIAFVLMSIKTLEQASSDILATLQA